MLHLIKAGNDADGNYNGDGENERSVKRLSAAVVSHEIEGSLLACVTHTYDSSALEDIGEEDGEEPTRGRIQCDTCRCSVRVLQLDHCWRASLPAETLQLTDAVLVNLSFAIQKQTQLFAIGNNASVSRTWELFDLLLGGALVKTVPLAASCYSAWSEYDAAEFEVVPAADPASIMGPLYEGRTCLPTDDPSGNSSENATLLDTTFEAIQSTIEADPFGLFYARTAVSSEGWTVESEDELPDQNC
ncbi:hypothetical protein KXV92_002209 [Aspergillus fumigatus]|nr:hypothetical protein KXX42_006310 [Aspergillus fumigatus]KAH1556940.1 hypothetical protein KXX57_008840 [Aspergillus fumigatus]KAH1986483.1 hypothetical protein KXW88_007374 [Aspergillus fumigatus]KAH3217847.1 hypothetical protein KXV92_002209 [Aspergillus fumigatus]KAH3279864.1 hypothetical protein KXW55_007176 [Aspergillus fumigatus]